MTLVIYRPQAHFDFANPELRLAQQRAIELVADLIQRVADPRGREEDFSGPMSPFGMQRR